MRTPDLKDVPAYFYYESLPDVLELALRNLLGHAPLPGHGGGAYPSVWTDAQRVLERSTPNGRVSTRGYQHYMMEA